MKLININKEKLQNAIIYFSRHTKHCGLTKVMKLLYFLDFIHFRQTGKSVTGQEYFAWGKGPVPKDVYEELTGKKEKGLGLKGAVSLIPQGESFQKVVPNKGVKFDPDVFSERELKILKQMAEIFQDATAAQMVETVHLKNHPWDKTKETKGLFSLIDYDLALDGSKDQLDPEVIKERRREIAEMLALFGSE